MDNEKRKDNGRERANKGGRPVKGAAEKLKYRITVKNGSRKSTATLSANCAAWRTT